MQRVNRSLRRRGVEGLFLTLAYALFDFPERTVRIANSGLPHPLHYRAAERRAAPVPVAGLPLGVFDGATYDEVQLDLGPGDILLFYTDGVVEALRGKEEFGPERLVRGLETHSALPAPALGERLLADLEAFVGGETTADDVTMIAVKIM
jgi:serine phosphatase RsbU (regulator of sigma subunit)